MSEPRFLVLRLGSLGDIVHTFPAVAALRATFPAAEIVWLTHPRWKVLVESACLASEVPGVETRSLSSVFHAIKRVRNSHWDAAIDYQGLWKSATLALLGGIDRRIGFSSETIREFGVSSLYTDRVRVTSKHIVEQNGELSVRAGAKNTTGDYKLKIDPESAAELDRTLSQNGIDRYVVLSPGGGWRSKCWPADRFGALCIRIRESLDLRCIINYAPGEEDLRDAVKASAGKADPFAYAGNLNSLMPLLRRAVCVVGGDTGPLHLAVALHTPTVALFGPTDPARNGPYPPDFNLGSAEDTHAIRSRQTSNSCAATYTANVVLRSPSVTTSHKRGNQPDASMLALDVDSVFQSVQRLIATTRSNQ